MRFSPPLVQGRFLRRYKRFFADVEVDGRVEVAHCSNTGAMAGLMIEGGLVGLRAAQNPKRKLAWTWMTARIGRRWVGVDPNLAVPLVEEALRRRQSLIPGLSAFRRVVPEVRYGREGRSRIDLLLAAGGQRPSAQKLTGRESWDGERRVYVEVKNATLMLTRGRRRVAAFPDGVTERGRKHLEELMHVVETGHRAAMVFVVQRSDCEAVIPAKWIDPEYARTLREAKRAGVEVYALGATAGLRRIALDRRLSMRLGG